ncbi:helix-turn-helix domain-containing protein [Corynebacterium sp. zg254]|uniref:helix-turn-helix domain-containing protein n=1 Tax=Corynebacterium sp. zg254 TaxID=2656645 RepID=UPI0021509C86|nr:helix-turn-helix transcriptional regulator [Corynebacterium sp. zg254]MCR5914884.1 helix-turn-helix domain-containing protein [Corynebacterium sp. zg254]
MPDPRQEAAAFGPRLRHVRLDRGLSQSGLASGICSPSAISRWENGVGLPTAETVEALAHRLNIDVHLLVGHGFDSRLAESTDSFADVLALALGELPSHESSSAMVSWIVRVQQALTYLRAEDIPAARRLIDDLAVAPLTSSTPAALGSVDILDALATLLDHPCTGTISSLVETLSWAKNAPGILRREALDVAVAELVVQDMPIAARDAVTRVAPSHITLTTQALLTCADSVSPDAAAASLPPAHPQATPRDLAFRACAHLCSTGASAEDLAEMARVLAPQDMLLRRWVTWARRT